MDSKTSFRDALEDLNAMILATDPCDEKSHHSTCGRFGETPSSHGSRFTDRRALGAGALSGLQNIDRSDRSALLSAVASAIAASTQCLEMEDMQSFTALEAAAAGLRELLEPQA